MMGQTMVRAEHLCLRDETVVQFWLWFWCCCAPGGADGSPKPQPKESSRCVPREAGNTRRCGIVLERKTKNTMLPVCSGAKRAPQVSQCEPEALHMLGAARIVRACASRYPAWRGPIHCLSQTGLSVNDSVLKLHIAGDAEFEVKHNAAVQHLVARCDVGLEVKLRHQEGAGWGPGTRRQEERVG